MIDLPVAWLEHEQQPTEGTSNYAVYPHGERWPGSGKGAPQSCGRKQYKDYHQSQ